jgi:hypothetical protein
MTFRSIAALLASVFLFYARPGPAVAQEPTPERLFSSQGVLRFALETDLDALISDRSQESEDQPAVLTIDGPSGSVVEVPLQVRTRGRFRLRKDICSFPPIRLNFRKSEPTGTVFDGQDKLKLVTHCHDRGSYEQNVLEEYLAYRIFNQLSDVSFRVRLVEITYRDSGGSMEPLTKMGFIIEDEDSMAERLGGMALDIPGARATEFEPYHTGLMFLFQYLIGNIDWSTANTQNLAVVRVGMDHFAVPYDFDWSGLVDAAYVGPSPLTERLHDSVRERLYLGVCWDGIDFPAVFRRFEEVRDTILGLVGEVPRLSEANAESASDYIESFYEFIEDPDRAIRSIGRMCQGG